MIYLNAFEANTCQGHHHFEVSTVIVVHHRVVKHDIAAMYNNFVNSGVNGSQIDDVIPGIKVIER